METRRKRVDKYRADSREKREGGTGGRQKRLRKGKQSREKDEEWEGRREEGKSEEH